MSYTSRPFHLNDLEAITRLSAQWGYAVSEKNIALWLQQILQHPDHKLIVTQMEGKIMGWIHGIYSLRIASAPFIEIAGLVVDAQYRKMGMGKQMVEEIIQWAKSKNCSQIRVRCQIARKEANIFYQRLGFQEVKQQKVYDLFV